MTHCGKLARPIVTVANVGLDNSRLWEELAKGQLVMKKASFAFRRAVCIPVWCSGTVRTVWGLTALRLKFILMHHDTVAGLCTRDVNLWVAHDSIPTFRVTIRFKIDFRFNRFLIFFLRFLVCFINTRPCENVEWWWCLQTIISEAIFPPKKCTSHVSDLFSSNIFEPF